MSATLEKWKDRAADAVMDKARARAAAVNENRARFPLTTEAIDHWRQDFPDARLIATDEGEGRGTFGKGVAPVLGPKKGKG